MINNSKSNYDIVFWSHGHVDIERYLPIMVSLKDKGIKPVLFYQNYSFKDGLTIAQQEIVQKYNLAIMDYSSFLDSIILKLISFLARLIKQGFLRNKLFGMRSKIIKNSMTESFIRSLVSYLNPAINFFDSISLVEYTDYPYGSFYVKKSSDSLNIKTLSIYQGGTGHVFESGRLPKFDLNLNFDKIYLPNEFERNRLMLHDNKIQAIAFGDPRFDTNWKVKIKKLFYSQVKLMFEKEKLITKKSILYLCPNLESLGEEKRKYNNLKDVIRISRELGNVALLVKPHPRYRHEGKIRKLAAELRFKDLLILENDPPLICYSDFVDYIISVTSSAVNDFLPEDFQKVIIYDNVSSQRGLINIYKDGFNYFDEYKGLAGFLKKTISGYEENEGKNDFVQKFCKKWISAGREMDEIVNDITDDICKEIEKARLLRGKGDRL